MKFFSKKVVLIILTVVLLGSGVLMGFLLNRKPKFPVLSVTPAAITISGNGSSAVMVDNFLYFVDAYVDAGSIEYKQNDYYNKGRMPAGAIYRVNLQNGKRDGNAMAGVPDYLYDNYDYDADDGSQYTAAYDDEHPEAPRFDRTIKQTLHVDKVVPKIAGHSATALWVYNDAKYGDILIYSTPNNKMNKTGVLQSAKLDFFRVKLNGSENTKIYTTEGENLTRDNFTVVWEGGNVYIMINDGGTLKRIGMSGKKKDTATVTDGISNLVFPKVTNYKKGDALTAPDKSFAGVMEYVYFTKTRDDNHSDNVMYRYHIKNGRIDTLASNSGLQNGRTYTPLLAADGRFLFTVAEAVGSTTVTKIYMSSTPNDLYSTLNTQRIDGNTLVMGDVDMGFPAISGMQFYLATENRGRSDSNPNGNAVIFALSGGKIYKCRVLSSAPERITFPSLTEYFTNADEFILAAGGYVYYKSGTTISVRDFQTGETRGGGISVSDQNSIPLSIIMPTNKNGEVLRGEGFLVYKMTENGIYLLDKNGYPYEIAINEKDNRPVVEPQEPEADPNDLGYDDYDDDGHYEGDGHVH